MTDGQPQFILPLGSPKKSNLSGPKIDYTVEMEDAIYVKLDAGIQHVKSDPYLFELEKPTILIDTENSTIMPGDEIEIEAIVENPPERYRLDWYIVNLSEEVDSLEPPKPIRTSELILSHQFEKEGVHQVTVKLYDKKRKMVVAEDYMDIVSEYIDLKY